MDLRHTHRLFVTHPLAVDASFTACEEHAHQLLHVLRMKTGDVVRVFNGHDGEYRGSIVTTRKKTVEIKIHDLIRPQQVDPDLWLCCAPIKKNYFDYLLEKATELGVHEIQPILTGRTQIRDVNIDRAHHICREASEQSDRLTVPKVNSPTILEDLLAVFPKDRALIVCAEWGEAVAIDGVLHSSAFKKFTKAAIMTGPEGGFAVEELVLLRKIPEAFFARLGPRILRADTAAIAALSCWQAIRGDWQNT